MTDFKELREALDRHAAVADPALLKDRQAWEQYRDDAYTIQYWGHEHRLRLLLDRLEAAERDAERLRKLTALIEWDGNGYWLPDLCIRERACGAESCPRPTLDDVRAAIDAMKDQQP